MTLRIAHGQILSLLATLGAVDCIAISQASILGLSHISASTPEVTQQGILPWFRI